MQNAVAATGLAVCKLSEIAYPGENNAAKCLQSVKLAAFVA